MPPTATAGVKRKRAAASRNKSSAQDDPAAEIERLESQILESRRHYNNLAALLSLARQPLAAHDTSVLAAVALCRVFSRLLATGALVKSKGMADSEAVIVRWLKARLKEYQNLLLDDFLRSSHPPKQSAALTLLMRLTTEESKAQKDFTLKHSSLPRLIEVLLLLPEEDAARDEFADSFFGQYDDVRYQTFQSIKHVLGTTQEHSTSQLVSTNSLALLLTLDAVPTSKKAIQNFYFDWRSTSPIPSLDAYRTQAQEAWLATIRSGLDKEGRKNVLTSFSHQIAPWFQQPELLMDFLTDSYNVGGATSLLALSGLYYLMSQKNLDYPSFYQKLYSLLDEGLLHSKHRSRFFRLLDTFMSSTHLPAALVASFIKRLSRLALHAPPAGIVVVVPWIYNMFVRHPACTFMMHRETRDDQTKRDLEEQGMEDPFDMNVQDPMFTNAIESSVWELEALQSHYHPNVATLAKIISEQFTKRSYNLEDFLDHSYTALLSGELAREMKKDPEVEFEIPKRTFTAEEGLAPLGQLMAQVLEAH